MARSTSGAAARHRQEHWRELLGQWQASGLSQAAFCRRRRLPVWKLAWWKKRLGLPGEHGGRRGESFGRAGRRGCGPRRPTCAAEGVVAPAVLTPSFVPVTVVAPERPSGRLELVLRDKRRLRFPAEVDPARLTAIIAALEAMPC